MKGGRYVIPLFLWAILLVAAIGARQSGRSWMNGIIFDESDTQGLKGAKIELIDRRPKFASTSIGKTDYTSGRHREVFDYANPVW